MGRFFPSYPFLLMICILWFVTNFIFFSELKWSAMQSGDMMSQRYIGLAPNESRIAENLAIKLDRLERKRYKLASQKTTPCEMCKGNVKHKEHLLVWQKLLKEKLNFLSVKDERKKQKLLELVKRRDAFKKQNRLTYIQKELPVKRNNIVMETLNITNPDQDNLKKAIKKMEVLKNKPEMTRKVLKNKPEVKIEALKRVPEVKMEVLKKEPEVKMEVLKKKPETEIEVLDKKIKMGIEMLEKKTEAEMKMLKKEPKVKLAVLQKNSTKSSLVVATTQNPLLLEPPGEYPGKGGAPVITELGYMTNEQKQHFNLGWQNNRFNQYASDLIPLNRDVGDVRELECRNVVYSEDLPKTSVIICFHNEAWSTLLRTVHSVLRNTQLKYLEEIILVDDFSTFPHLKAPLEDYVKRLSKVRIVRSAKREGLIRARLLGYGAAKGEVLTFLDSHCECTKDWLRPMLQRITEDPMAIPIPVIDRLDENTFQYWTFNGLSINIGIFQWDLTFNWAPVFRRMQYSIKSPVDPIKTPTMAGGLFSIRKETFAKLGAYDPGFDTWGAENLELSFKAWMCGGTLEILPCSHVGHVFRGSSPYKWQKGMTEIRTNGIRLAEVWMDEYKEEFYKRIGYQLGNYGDVSQRKKLRAGLHCRSFNWYLHNIYPEALWIKSVVILGPLMNRLTQTCLFVQPDYKLAMVSCSMQEPLLYMAFSNVGEIRIDRKCLAITNRVVVLMCHGKKGTHEWKIDSTGQILHVLSKQCLDVDQFGQIIMKPCINSMRQMWTFLRTEKPHRKII